MEKLTVIIPTGNEEPYIEGALKSVTFADEILVVDSFSKDRTLEIVRKYTNKIIQREYINSASQKNWAIPQATHSWIFLLDADERVTPQLKEEICKILKNPPDKDGFWVYRSNFFMGKQIKYSGWGRDKVIRLFKRDHCRYQEKRVHSEVEAAGSIGTLENKLLHYPYKGFDNFIIKANRYSWWQAHDFAPRIEKVTAYHLIAKPLFRFFKSYILNLGFLDGKQGLIIAFIQLYRVFTRYVKVWIIKNGPFPGAEDEISKSK